MTSTTTTRRGRPKKLEFDDVVETALAILDADGIEAVSFRRIAAELGVSHMTLYTYFDSKESLTNAMVARTLEVPALEEAGGRRWDARLDQAMREIHAVLVRRPGIAQLLITHEFEGEWIDEIRSQLLALLEPAGLGKQRTTDGISALFNYLFGTVMVESSRGLGGSETTFDYGLGLLIDGLRRAAGVRAPRRAA
jgi:TetR/AcrR family transcriptional regulator, tetracycline repressor protein